MKTLSILTLTLFCLPFTSGAEDSDIAGHYYLVNQMETASQLLLKPDHTFMWWLAIGNADYRANGTWRKEGDKVIIETEQTPALTGSPKLIPFDADEAERILNPMNRWQVIVAVKKVGGVADLDVVFEDNQGQRYQDTTNHRGEALAPVPEQGEWTRVGIRHQNDQHDYTWFALKDLHPIGTSIAFWVKEKEWAMKQPFTSMTLIIAKDMLTSTPDNMVYRKKTD